MFELWHTWIITGIVLWIVEIFTTGFVVGVFGTACIIVSFFAGKNFSLEFQLLIFCITTALIFFSIRPLVLKYLYRREEKVKTNVDAIIGESGLVVEIIDHINGTGRVKIGGEIWRAIALNESQVEIGKRVIIREIEGCKVVVEVDK